MSPLDAYQSRLTSLREQLARLDRISSRWANLRGLLFLGAAVLAGFLLFGELEKRLWWVVGALGAAYGAAAFAHHRVLAREERAKLRVSLNERGVARVTGKWHDFPEKGERYLEPDHLYAPDLDVFGQGSLFQLLDETGTRLGEQMLASWLSAPAPPEALVRRQGAIRELTPLNDFRQDLVVESRLVSRAKADPSGFIAWAELPSALEKVRWAKALPFILPPATIALFLLARADVVPSAAVWGALIVQLLVARLVSGPLSEYFGRISSGEGGFVRFEHAFEQVEAGRFEHPWLRSLQSGLHQEEGRVSERLRAFGRVYSFAEMKISQLGPILNLFLLWDLLWLFRVDRWRVAHGAKVRRWFEALADLEALSSLAAFAHDHPRFAYPVVTPDGPRFEARGLGHPLLDQPVRNDVALVQPRSALVITGSNMSGKTTLLRAMGTNAVLAQAGAPVCADELRMAPAQVLTSMRVKDSLERGVSYFYAEVKRLKLLLDAASARQGAALFLLDEILLGTNTRERQIASREVLVRLIATGAVGAVTTHDLNLTTLAGRQDLAVRNIHFRDQLVDGQMSFDYRLRDGVVETTNALRVLQHAGIDIAVEP